MFLRTCCLHGSVFTDWDGNCQPGSINMLNSLASTYSPNLVERKFCELRLYGVLRSSHGSTAGGLDLFVHFRPRTVTSAADRGYKAYATPRLSVVDLTRGFLPYRSPTREEPRWCACWLRRSRGCTARP